MTKCKVLSILGVALFLIGFLVCIYPWINKCYINYKMTGIVDRYLHFVTPNESEEETFTPVSENENDEFIPNKYTDLWKQMKEYNRKICEEKQSGLCDVWTYENPSFELTEYGLQEDVFGVITIPKMELQMPLYLGANWQHMADGAALLSQTSIPIGGENTNSVIAGHRGWYGSPYFREILKLEIGDKVYIRNLWQKLEYQVSEIQIIEPDDVDAIHIQEGRDMITLLTCHPYASGGQQRYLVMCDRIIESEEKSYEQTENSRENCTSNSGT